MGLAVLHAGAVPNRSAVCRSTPLSPQKADRHRERGAAGAPAAFLWPFGPRRRRRALNPAADRMGRAPLRQRWCLDCKRAIPPAPRS